jgi:shikimate dehydrogenase
MISGATTVAAVIGDPVDHSRSPLLHNAGYRAAGLDWVYVAFPVAAGGGTAAVEAVRALALAGLNVTMPLKAEVAAAVDRCTRAAEALGAVNTVVREGRSLVGDTTDGPGFVAALRADHGLDLGGRSVVVVGAGGAARAVVRAVAEEGAAAITVVARRAEAAARAAALAGGVGRVGDAEAAGDADLVVNATPLGMHGRLDLPLDPHRLGPGQVVVDLVYDPPVTPLLRAARERGAAASNGLGMLLHQAGLSFRLFTGVEPPLEAMRSALVAGTETSASSCR